MVHATVQTSFPEGGRILSFPEGGRILLTHSADTRRE